MTNRALLHRAQSGERAAMEELLGQLAPKLRRFGRQLCSSYSEDALQESLLAIAEHLPAFKGEADLSSWSYSIVRSACSRLTRGKVVKNSAPLEVAAELPDAGRDPELRAMQAERRHAFNCAMQSLSEPLREAVLLRDVEELTAEEAASALELTVPALKSRLHRGRRALAKALDTHLKRGLASTSSSDCPDVLSALSQEQEGDLPERECAELAAHLATCERCSQLCQDLKQALVACREAEAHAGSLEAARCAKAALRRWQQRHASPKGNGDERGR